MKDVPKYIIVIGFFILVRFLAGAVMTDIQVRQIRNGANDKNSKIAMSVPEARKSWNEGCDPTPTVGGAFNQTTYCNCVFDSLVDTYGINWIANMGLTKTQTELQTAFKEPSDACIYDQTSLVN